MDRPVYFLQTDTQWGANDYSSPGESTTIAKAGCGPTSAAMVIASLKDKTVTPAVTARWSLEHGYKACKQGTYYSYFIPQLKQYGISCERINTDSIYGSNSQTAKEAHKTAVRELKKGNWIIACMGKGVWTSSGHYVLAYKTENGKIYINDPASTKSMRQCNSLELWQSQVKYYWIIEVTPEKKEDDEVIEERNINLLGKECTGKAIFKDGSNYFSPRVFENIGLKVGSQGSTPIISMDTVKVSVNGAKKTISGFNGNGTVYCGIRQLAELLGHEVSWEDGVVLIK